MEKAMFENKNGRCTYESAEAAMDFLTSIRSDSLKFLCRDFNPEESDTCDRYLSEPNLSTPVENYHFFFFPLIKSLTNF